MKQIKKIGIIGAGHMGGGIAQAAIEAGYEVYLFDVKQSSIDKALATIKKNFNFLVGRAKTMCVLEKNRALSLLTTHVDKTYATATYCDMIIEAVDEDEALKEKVHTQIAKICREDAVVTSNSSTYLSSWMASFYSDKTKFVGMHYFGPVNRMALVEIPVTEWTSEDTLATVLAVAKKMGKTAITVKDSPGMVFNRIHIPWVNEGFLVLEEGVASAEDIDTIMRLGGNIPMGPHALDDLIKSNTDLAIMQALQKGLGSDKYQPASLLVKKAKAFTK